MYTRNQSTPKPSDAARPHAVGVGGHTIGGGIGTGGMPILIPQDYHGEFLRDRRERIPIHDDDGDEIAPPDMLVGTADDGSECALAVGGPTADASVQRGRESGTSLLGGLYDLLLGENSEEEETLLLLAIALLLLWGHLDRGGLFERSTWDSDDLALLLIGYLLLS